MNVLLSIKPQYVEEILNGNKRYEFRKTVLRSDKVERAYIYSTSPIQKIVGSFSVKKIFEEHPKTLWDRYKEFAGIGEDAFFDYFKDREKGFAIRIDELNVFDEPKEPKEFIPNFYPPQNFCYMKHQIEDSTEMRKVQGNERNPV